jgi:pimeloyl-ACP methyl ester carboxylesterase
MTTFPGARAPLRDDGQGPAVVLLHSSMSSKSQWRALTQRLRDRYRTIAIDLIGYGDAGPAERSSRFGLADEMERVDALLAARLGKREAYHLVGHSYGGAVALRLALARPQQVSSLTLFEPTAFHLLPRDEPALIEVRAVAAEIAQSVAQGEDRGATRRFIDFWNGPGSFAQLDAGRREAFAGLLPKTALDFQAIFAEPLRLAQLRALAVPTALLGGRDSPSCVHAVLQALARTLPRAELAWVAGGHMAPVTDPGRVDPLIDAFLELVERDGARCRAMAA